MLFLSSVFLLIPCYWYGLFCISYFIVDPIKIWKVLMCFGACPDWFTISFFKKTHFFSLNFHCFYKQFTKFTALFYLTLFTIIHLYFKSIQIKFAGEFLLTSFNGFSIFFGCKMQIRYYSFSTFAQNETMLTTTLILKNPTKRQANQKRPVLRSCFQF